MAARSSSERVPRSPAIARAASKASRAGWTVAATRQALADIGAVEVDLESGDTGYLLLDDLEPIEAPEPWVALLPALDATTMGWSGRDWYLGPHRPQLFDTNGNAGPTIWVDGRVVGAWAQRRSGEIAVLLLEDVGGETARMIEAEAVRLEEWIGPTRVSVSFPTPLASSGPRSPGTTPTRPPCRPWPRTAPACGS